MKLFGKLFKSSTTSNELTMGKNPKAFDTKKERELLNSYKKYKSHNNSDEYFAALPMIDFYYKFRNLDNIYLEECIRYCYVCIACLDSPDMKKDIKTGIVIPAFRKLIIIYENKKEYDTAIQIAQKALIFSSNNEEEKNYYNKKLKSIINKNLKNRQQTT